MTRPAGKLESSPDAPLPLRVVAAKIGGWIARLGEVWIEGQVAQLTRRPGVPTQFLTLRDTDANISITVTCARQTLPETVSEGSRLILRARPDFYLERGQLSLRASEIRPVGLGELLARLEQLRRMLAAEGLFAVELKRPLPFWPHTVGLVTGRASAAERDVVENVGRRAPGTRFRIENVATQGVAAVSEVVAAIERLDADADVEVIVVARGGGSVEDLLPFSNEALVRAVARARTPVVSAIGHETDRPLLDLVADVAASTPTDAARRVVPDLAAEIALVDELAHRLQGAVRRRVAREIELVAGLPERLHQATSRRIESAAADVVALRARSRRRTLSLVEAAASDIEHTAARIRALSPQATLERGYAVVQRADGTAVRDPAEADGDLAVRVAFGRFTARRVP